MFPSKITEGKEPPQVSLIAYYSLDRICFPSDTNSSKVYETFELFVETHPIVLKYLCIDRLLMGYCTTSVKVVVCCELPDVDVTVTV